MRKFADSSWLEISRQALIHNISVHRRLLGEKVKLMAVVKSNAYGHGLEAVAQVCQKSKQVDWLGVASLNEAKLVRSGGVKLPILVLSYFRPFIKDDLVWAIKHGIDFMVYEPEQLKVLARAARQANQPARIHLKLETGMARLGLFPNQARDFLLKIITSPHWQLAGIASHFATAEATNHTFLRYQLATYKKFIRSMAAYLPPDLLQHIACSAAITTEPSAHLSLVRLGLALYGLWPSLANQTMVQKKLPSFTLRPALTWKTQVIEVQKLSRGTPVGYDRTYVTRKPTLMAVLPVGYWDGLDRKLSNKGYVFIKGVRCRIIGRVCMNITMVDASPVADLKPGDEVILMGGRSGGEVSADKIAALTGTINYEVVTRINPLLPRILV